jgi:outer membrane receptor for monomeric catechols
MRSPITLVAATSLIALTAPARAAEAAPDPLAATAAAVAAESAEGEQIVVEGQRDRYGVRNISSATRTDTPLKDVPQAVSIITAEQIDDQAMRSVADVLRYVPGASLSGGEGHRDQIALRGQATTADFFVDGFRDDVQYYRGLYNLERVEVLKGPNAMMAAAAVSSTGSPSVRWSRASPASSCRRTAAAPGSPKATSTCQSPATCLAA